MLQNKGEAAIISSVLLSLKSGKGPFFTVVLLHSVAHTEVTVQSLCVSSFSAHVKDVHCLRTSMKHSILFFID